MPHPLLQTWRTAHTDFRDVVQRAPWQHDTLLPGWSVADIAAHTAWIERTALGLKDPLHEPDWASLPHAATPFGRVSEVPVDLRRSWPRERVLDELDAAVAELDRDLSATDAQATARSILGPERPIGQVLRDRVFDLWVHEQDIRVAVGDPGHLDTEPARVAAQVLVGGLGFVWAKRARAPLGASLVLTTTAPGLELQAAVQVQDDGRARAVDPVPEPTVRLIMPFPQFVAHACGRRNADPAAVEVVGDQALGLAAVAGMAITP